MFNVKPPTRPNGALRLSFPSGRESGRSVWALNEAISSLIARGRARWTHTPTAPAALPAPATVEIATSELVLLTERLLSRRGEASGVAIAEHLLKAVASASDPEKLNFLLALANRFGADLASTRAAAEAYIDDPTQANAQALHAASEPVRHEVFRRLNLAPGGTAALVRLREALLKLLPEHPNLKAVDADLHYMFTSWFNRGFLTIKPVDWTTSAVILERIIRYEAVHEISDWQDLRRRTEPADRRCFAFFHPSLADDPLIFVEVALTRELPGAIGPLLAADRRPLAPNEATCAVFYSISNCQQGLQGISFGHFLIKQVAAELKKELPQLTRFVTLSPVPGFARWLDAERKKPDGALRPEVSQALSLLDSPTWSQRPENREALRAPLLQAAAHYFLYVKDPKGRHIDPVARFHLGNGAQLEQLNMLGDLSAKGLKQSKGLMVNYLYDLDKIEERHEAFAGLGVVTAAPAMVRALGAPADRSHET